MIIRQETPNDYDTVFELVKAAFEKAEHTDGKEHFLVEKLRKSEAFVPELSLVAEIEGKILGHILLTKAKVGASTQLALAPLAVLPDIQKQGIGGALIKEAHRIAKELGYEFSILLGHPSYYPKFGYVPAENFGIKAPFDVPSECFMAIDLQDCKKNLNAEIAYPKEFFED